MKKQLPHFSKIHSYQFITFRTQDSVDEFLLRLKASSQENESIKQMKIDAYLDGSINGRYLNGEIIDVVIDHCKTLEPECYQLICLSVMPNHIHILFEQYQDLGEIVCKLKGGLAFKINKKLNLSGSFLERDYYDKTIRNEKHLKTTYDYIKNNASKANLKDAKSRFYSCYN
jgi:REP element-mobilizing transposase RayT